MIKGGKVERSPKDVRMETFNSFKEVFASAPIRLMSRTVSAMRAMGYDDLASAIGDLDWQTVPEDDPAAAAPDRTTELHDLLGLRPTARDGSAVGAEVAASLAYEPGDKIVIAHAPHKVHVVLNASSLCQRS